MTSFERSVKVSCSQKLSWLLFLAAVSVGTLVQAHPLDVGLLEINRNDTQVVFNLELNPQMAVTLLDQKVVGMDTEKAVNENKSALAAIYLQPNEITAGNFPCAFSNDFQVKYFSETRMQILGQANCKSGAEAEKFSVTLPFLKSMPKSFQLISKFRDSGIEQIAKIDGTTPFLSFKPQVPERSFLKFVSMGMEHIGFAVSEWHNETGWHFPGGIDHILFVVALVLSSLKLVEICKTVTGFTIGHSVTLFLGAFNYVNVPSNWVESAIALSISLVAAESLWLKRFKSKWPLAASFGLLHGLGFASAVKGLSLNLKNVLSTLLGFNLGVEIGQIGFVLLVFPLFYSLNKSDFGKRYFLVPTSFVIFAIGLNWFVNRATGFNLI